LRRVKRGPFSLHILNQFLDTIKGWLIRHAGRHETIMLDFLVNLDAPLTHGQFRILVQSNSCRFDKTRSGKFVHIQRAGCWNGDLSGRLSTVPSPYAPFQT
jgi:hypothetical protein